MERSTALFSVSSQSWDSPSSLTLPKGCSQFYKHRFPSETVEDSSWASKMWWAVLPSNRMPISPETFPLPADCVSRRLLWCCLLLATGLASQAFVVCGDASQFGETTFLPGKRLRGQGPQAWKRLVVYNDDDHGLMKVLEESDSKEESESADSYVGTKMFLSRSKLKTSASSRDGRPSIIVPDVGETVNEGPIRLGVDGTDGLLIPEFRGSDTSIAHTPRTPSIIQRNEGIDGERLLRGNVTVAAKARTVVRSFWPSFDGSRFRGATRIEETTTSVWSLPQAKSRDTGALRKAKLQNSRTSRNKRNHDEMRKIQRPPKQQNPLIGFPQSGLLRKRADVSYKMQKGRRRPRDNRSADGQGRLRRRTHHEAEKQASKRAKDVRYNRISEINLVTKETTSNEEGEDWHRGKRSCMRRHRCSHVDLRQGKFLRMIEI